jgi:hypothetical protein
VVAHLVLFLFGRINGRLPEIPRRPSQIVVLAPPSEGPREVPMVFRRGEEPNGRRGRGPAPTPALPRPKPETPVVVEERPPRPAVDHVDTSAAPAAPRRPAMIGRIGPGLAEGRLWVRPLPLPPKELAERLTQEKHVELVDSAVTAIVQAYLDSSHIYVAGLKIPAAVLALLPIPGGNLDQNRAYNHLMEMRSDLYYAAQQSQNLQEFRQMIRDMRLRKEREEEFKRNQRTAPPPQEPPTP